MTPTLVELEQRALEFKQSGRLAEAAYLFSTIVTRQPNWEHGTALHLLGQCYEDLGRLELAEEFYRNALEYEPLNENFLGVCASFLYLYGKPEAAFAAHVTLLKNYGTQDRDNVESCIMALNALGERLGWSRGMIAEQIAGSGIRFVVPLHI